MSTKQYIFKSKRLGFRNWNKDDLTEFSKINSDSKVMEYFPNTLSTLETEEFIERLQKHYDKRGYNYFATEILKTGELIGFIGMADQNYDTNFCPTTDIGWRLKQSSWNKGYATEGAKKCLAYAFDKLKIDTIIATCTIHNKNSENVMIKIGMTKKGTFNHPKLKAFPEYEKCIWYEIKKPQIMN